MHPPIDTVRRGFLVSAAGATAALVVVTSSGCQGASKQDRQLQFASLDEALKELNRLVLAPELVSQAVWSWAQTLAHCAQSIEYSMTGFPQPKSRLFQSTVGAAAFSVFAWRGRMSHDLAEPIPGAPALESASDTAAAVTRVVAAIQAFQKWTGPLQPHFAYGDLRKPEYEVAHALHLANHLSAFSAKA